MQNVDFSQVAQASGLTCRRSLDDTLFVIKYPEGSVPTFINTGVVVPSEILDHEQAVTLMATPEWSEGITP